MRAENYNCVDVHGNEIASLAPLEGAKVSKLVFDYSDSIDFDKLGQAETYEYYIFNCPMDKQVSVGESLGEFKVSFEDEGSWDSSILNVYLQDVEGEVQK